MDIEKAKKRCNELTKAEHANWIGISNQEAIETVLKELDKKESDLYESNNRISDLLDIADKKDKQILKEKIVRQMSEEADKKILEFKDKIINAMAEDIRRYEIDAGYENTYKNKEEVIDYFIKKVTKED